MTPEQQSKQRDQIEQQCNRWGQIVAKAWEDESFKKRLMAEPAAVLKECGLLVPPGVEVRLVENTDQVMHLPLPAQPASRELSSEELAGVTGGALIATEWVFVATILVLGIITGLTAVKAAPAGSTSTMPSSGIAQKASH